MKKVFAIILSLLCLFAFAACNEESEDISENHERVTSVIETGRYTSWDAVSLYIHTYNKLPPNFLSEEEANERGGIEKAYAKNVGTSLGGMDYDNANGVLYTNQKYKMCDISYDGETRGVKFLAYTDDGKIYYTKDGGETFTRLY
ncbi:MAG: hypothetical protein MJ145_03500 [Clostridia bacterium]|nr:hypothetical protein [Clostridia bacterium]